MLIKENSTLLESLDEPPVADPGFSGDPLIFSGVLLGALLNALPFFAEFSAAQVGLNGLDKRIAPSMQGIIRGEKISLKPLKVMLWIINDKNDNDLK
jgi:hypothetical protein